MVYLGADERRARTNGISNAEGVLREGVQDSTGIVEEFEGLVAGVDDGRGDPQVFQPVDIGVGGRGPDGQAGGGRDGNRRGDEDDERRAKGRRKHCEGVRRVDCNETVELNDWLKYPSGLRGHRKTTTRGRAGVHEYMPAIGRENERPPSICKGWGRRMEGLLDIVALDVTGCLVIEVTSPVHNVIRNVVGGEACGAWMEIELARTRSLRGRGQRKYRATTEVDIK